MSELLWTYWPAAFVIAAAALLLWAFGGIRPKSPVHPILFCVGLLCLALSAAGVSVSLHRFERTLNETRALAGRAYHAQAEQAVRAILARPERSDPKRLGHYEYRVYSQNGEDGILAEIFRRIGATNRVFVEFGSSDGEQNNTVLLLIEGWSGLWMDGDHHAIQKAGQHFAKEIAAQRLKVRETFITAENIESLFREQGVPPEFDLLSIDIDRNDYYVWKRIEAYRPRAVVIEYNPLFPPALSWVIPYDPEATWDGTSHTSASLKALELLGAGKGYKLVGCTLAGVNAFFVRDDLVGDRFAAPFTAENHYEPARYYMDYPDTNHPRRPW